MRGVFAVSVVWKSLTALPSGPALPTPHRRQARQEYETPPSGYDQQPAPANAIRPQPNFGAVLWCSAAMSSAIGQAMADETADAQFENHIRPILVESCFRCHGDAKTSGTLRVDSREALLAGGESGAAIVPGKPEESLLIKAIQRHEDVSAMPPEKDKALRPDQVAAFEEWISSGAHWPADAQENLKVTNIGLLNRFAIRLNPRWLTRHGFATASTHSFDRVRRRLEFESCSCRRTSCTLIRRATFDLTGLPPTPDEVDAFLQDESPQAFERLIDRLLASTHYGERWGRHWLDVVRYADTAGETADYPVPLAWRYRNYVIDAFNADKPYDQFLREQIAGDVLANQEPSEKYAEQVIATGYLAISRRFGFDSENYHHLTIQDTIDTLGQSVLGLSLGCARCHDHKFDADIDERLLRTVTESSTAAVMRFPVRNRSRNIGRWCRCCHRAKQYRNGGSLISESERLPSSLEKQQQPVPLRFCDHSATWTVILKCRHRQQAAAMVCLFRRGFTKAGLLSRMPLKVRSGTCMLAVKWARVSLRISGDIESHSHSIRNVRAATATPFS